MKLILWLSLTLLAFSSNALATVRVQSPTSGAPVGTAALYTATASTTTCKKGVASMGVYVENVLVAVQQGAKFHGTINLTPGNRHTVVEEWDYCGGATYVKLNVLAVAPSATVSLTASPSSIVSGKSATLTASATNATQLRISGSDGSIYILAAAGGSVVVTDTRTVTYVATATGSGASASSMAILSVTPAAPVLSLNASPATVVSGKTAIVTASAANATQVTISGSDGSSYTLPATGGSVPVEPAQTTTYTATATGVGGSTFSKTLLTIIPAQPTVGVSANPATIVAGNSSLLTVTSTGAASVIVTGSDGSTYTLAATGGSISISPKETTSYRAGVTGAGGTSSATATLTVSPAPLVVTVSASPATIATGGSSVLTISATAANQLKVTGSDGSNYTLPPSGGTVSVTPKETTTYTATAVGTSSDVTAATTVNMNTHTIPANAVSSGYLEDAKNWEWNHDPGTPGTSVGTSQYPLASPSMNNKAREYSYSYYDHGGEIYHISFARDSVATHFVYDTYIYLTDPSQIQNVEMDMNQVIPNGDTVILGSQCAGGSGTWEFTTVNKGGTRWSKSNISCDPSNWSANTWHHIQIATHRDSDGVATYDWVNFDGTYTDFQNASGPSALSLNWAAGDLLINLQLDGASTGNGSATVYTDQLQIYRW